MKIGQAAADQYEEVRSFYHSLIDEMEERYVAWEKDVYPSPELLKGAIGKGELYIGTVDDEIAAAMVFNSECDENYSKVHWQTEAEPSEVMVIHALGVHPRFMKRGYGCEMVEKAIETAKEKGAAAIRLDVLEGNIPAEKLYVSMGFRFIEEISMYYEDTGLARFRLFEYVLKNR